MEINTLPTELLEQIFKKITYEKKCAQRANLRQIALVYKRWSAIIIPMIWKEMEIIGTFRTMKSTAFSFYRHIIKAECCTFHCSEGTYYFHFLPDHWDNYCAPSFVY